jgi:Lon protease (S16) C-terminal proteolytic domain
MLAKRTRRAGCNVLWVPVVGVVMGLAWTSLGGNALYIEAAVVEKGDGKGGLRTTGGLPGCAAATLQAGEPQPKCLMPDCTSSCVTPVHPRKRFLRPA